MVHGLSTCSHCGALLNGPTCAICGKSERDEVETDAPAPRERGLSPALRRQLVGIAGFAVVATILGGGAYALLTREATEPEPLALATPTPTSSTTTIPAPTVQPPTIERPVPAEPLPTIDVGVERSIEPTDGANPWNGALARNVISGEPLDNVDYRPGMQAVAELLGRTPTDFTFGDPTQTEWNAIDLGISEASQPFAARSVGDDTGTIADVWLIARGDSTTDGSAAFLDQAITAWVPETPLDTFSPRPGIRLVQISDDGTQTVWIDQRTSWLAVYRAPSGTDAGLLGAISDGWT